MNILLGTLATVAISTVAIFSGPTGGKLTAHLTDAKGNKIDKTVSIDECKQYSQEEMETMLGISFSDYSSVKIELECKGEKGDKNSEEVTEDVIISRDGTHKKVIKISGDSDMSKEDLDKMLKDMDIDINIDLDGDNVKMIHLDGEEFDEEKLNELLKDMEIDINIDGDENGEKKVRIMKWTGEDGEEIDINKMMEEMGIEMGNIELGEEGEFEFTTEDGKKVKMIKVHADGEHAKHEGKEKRIVVNVNTNTNSDGNAEDSETTIETIQGGEVKVMKFSGNELTEEEIQAKLKEMGIDVEALKADGAKVITKTIRIECKVDDASKEDIAKANKQGAKLNTKGKALEMTNFVLAPNPTEGNLEIQATMLSNDPVNISVYSMNGKLVKQIQKQKLNGNNLSVNMDLTGEESGIYLVQIEQRGRISTKKVILN